MHGGDKIPSPHFQGFQMEDKIQHERMKSMEK
jgi:hypothetical protein